MKAAVAKICMLSTERLVPCYCPRILNLKKQTNFSLEKSSLHLLLSPVNEAKQWFCEKGSAHQNSFVAEVLCFLLELLHLSQLHLQLLTM